MRVNRPHQVFDCGFEFHGGDGFGDQFGGLRADDVDAEDFAVVGVADDFDEAFVLADDAGARIRGEGELADLHVVSGFAGSGFGEADAADFRMAIRRAGNVLGVDRLGGLAGDFCDGDQRFHGSNVRQLRGTEHDVADGVDAGLGGLHPGIGFDEFAVGLDLCFLETDILRARLAAYGDQDLVGFDLLLLAFGGDGDGDSCLRRSRPCRLSRWCGS